MHTRMQQQPPGNWADSRRSGVHDRPAARRARAYGLRMTSRAEHLGLIREELKIKTFSYVYKHNYN